MVKAIKKKSIPEEIIEQIKFLIINGEWVPNEKIPAENELARMFGVSRSSVREALRALSLIGLFDIRIGDGTYLNSDLSIFLSESITAKFLVKRSNTIELFEARKTIETDLAGFAAERVTAEQLQSLKKNLEGMEANINNNDIFIKNDLNFHITVAEAAHNIYLFEVINTIRTMLEAVQVEVLLIENITRTSLEYHKKIYNAIKGRDKNEAAHYMYEHIAHVEENILKPYKSC